VVAAAYVRWRVRVDVGRARVGQPSTGACTSRDALIDAQAKFIRDAIYRALPADDRNAP
jgi:hypothetical protein